ncbi:heat shock protein HslJ [Hymenobacter luteus]|uniref:Heat shock protein HslJ n=2 Tax=Hymenobacter TaxID=89966 RepID=A0A7W9SY63_9BACT|nr:MULTISPECIES: META domain-containing protein [Hymenobacter]MBB4599794.1 heat shock protein HslJ [Hymenobacter latericoloratus]MBB6057896.1 heat shock protein HslJ [Hymenobacter luteus]
MRLFTLALGFAGLSVLGSCQDDRDPNPEELLLNTRWQLVQVEETPVSVSSYSDTFRSYIRFTTGPNRTEGLAPCNSFGGTFTLGSSRGVLSISGQSSTKATCPAQALEDKYLAALPRTAGYEISGQELRLYDASNTLRPLLIFEKAD